MKRFLSITLSLSFALFFMGSAHAFDVGGSVKSTTKDVGKQASRKAVQGEINKKLKKEECHYSDPKTIQPMCDVDKIVSLLSSFRTTAESSGFANDVDIHITAWGPDSAIAHKRANYLRDKVKAQIGYWDYYTKPIVENKINKAEFQVQVD